MTTTDEQLGAMARAIRQGVGLTLTEASRLIGTSRQTLGRVERGERWLDPGMSKDLVCAYAVAMRGATS